MQPLEFLKNVAKKFLLAEAEPTATTRGVYRRLDGQFLADRTFYFGRQKMRAHCLAMEAAPGTAEMVIQLLQAQGAHQAQKILDFGCGQHRSQYLKKMGFNVHSCDILDMNVPNFIKINPAVSALPFSDGEFDVVVASEVLEHVESPWELLCELVRIAKKKVIVTTPNPVSLKSRRVFLKTGYLYWFSPENFQYHISPVFSWQVELFCKRHNVALSETAGNHQAFELNAGSNILDMAEALIFGILKSN